MSDIINQTSVSTLVDWRILNTNFHIFYKKLKAALHRLYRHRTELFNESEKKLTSEEKGEKKLFGDFILFIFTRRLPLLAVYRDSAVSLAGIVMEMRPSSLYQSKFPCWSPI